MRHQQCHDTHHLNLVYSHLKALPQNRSSSRKSSRRKIKTDLAADGEHDDSFDDPLVPIIIIEATDASQARTRPDRPLSHRL